MIEAGGKDAVLVDEDADLDAAADAALWGACSNAGQTCIGVERVYVHDRVYDEFLSRLLDKARDLRADDSPDAKIGPITMPEPARRDPLAHRATPSTAAAGRCSVARARSGERYVQPTILVDVPEDSTAVQEETFGPTVTVTRVQGHGRGGRQGQRHPLRPRLDGVRQGARRWSSPRGSGRA